MRRGIARVVSAGFFMLAAILVVAGCNQNTESSVSAQKGKSEQSSGENLIKIGITQIVEHPALDSIRQGIVDQLAKEGFEDGKTIQLDYANAQGDINNVTTIAQQMTADKKDMIIPITTQSTQAVLKQANGIPIVFAGVTDPVAAKIVPALDKPGEHITGMVDVAPMDKEVDLITKFIPNVKKIGIIYNTGEINAGVQVKMIEEAAKAKNIIVEKAGISSSNEMKDGAESIVHKVDAILVPKDNMVVSSFEALLQVAQTAKVPIFASDSDTVKRGAVATYGIDYYKTGQQTGKIAVRVLKGEKPSAIPVQVAQDVELVINNKSVAAFNLEIPASIKQEARIIHE